MTKIIKFKDFLNEEKGFDPTPKAPRAEIETESRAIIRELFANPEDDRGHPVQRTIEFDHEDGIPVSVSFEVHPTDWAIRYTEPLSFDRSAAVAAKRANKVSLVYRRRWRDSIWENGQVIAHKFVVMFDVVAEVKGDVDRMAVIKYSKFSTRQLKEVDRSKVSEEEARVIDGILAYRKEAYRRKKKEETPDLPAQSAE